MQPKAQIIYRKLSDLKELPNNPRRIKKDQFEKLKQSIKDNADYFEARPLILSNRTGELVILAGNQRFKASKALGLEEVPTVLLEGLTEEREREIIIRDNVNNGEWDMDLLANEWDGGELGEWGLDGIVDLGAELDDIIDEASTADEREFSDDSDYDLAKLIRKEVAAGLRNKLKEAQSKGLVRTEIIEILQRRMEQMTIFNFDEIAKFYRSDDATADEKWFLEQLYLVFLTPKDAFEKGLAKLTGLSSGRIEMDKHFEDADE